MSYDDNTTRNWVIGITASALVIIAAIMGIFPTYNVWSREKEGQAEYARAEQNRRIKVLEAQALMDSAKLQAQAEVERAKGVAEANKIVADGLKGNDEYLRYLWIDKVSDNPAREVIYVPTEAALPILEAGKNTRAERQ